MNLKRVVTTADGSKTLFDPESGENYHSKHGAVGESKHVFIGMGLKHVVEAMGVQHPCIFEVGFGTGLNFLLSANWAMQSGVSMDYYAVEVAPISLETLTELHYKELVSTSLWYDFKNHYDLIFNELSSINSSINLKVFVQQIQSMNASLEVDVVYFDAFSATHQPEMWTPEILSQVIGYLRSGGIFVTYSITGELKRCLKSLGCTIEKLPGAPGKREMLRATKL